MDMEEEGGSLTADNNQQRVSTTDMRPRYHENRTAAQTATPQSHARRP